MKKNKMMRLASALLVAVMLTTCTISGTYAKYVTSEDNTDTARVAMFNVSITDDGELFLSSYGRDNLSYDVTANTVESSDSDLVVAPGTTKFADTLKITGSTEVATRVEFDSEITLTNWDTTYFPIIFTVGTESYGMNYMNDKLGNPIASNQYTTVADLLAAVEGAMEAYSAYVAPNKDYSTVAYPTLTWEWPFESYTAVDHINDAEDTNLGREAVTKDIQISVYVKASVTQVD